MKIFAFIHAQNGAVESSTWVYSTREKARAAFFDYLLEWLRMDIYPNKYNAELEEYSGPEEIPAKITPKELIQLFAQDEELITILPEIPGPGGELIDNPQFYEENTLILNDSQYYYGYDDGEHWGHMKIVELELNPAEMEGEEITH
mgnify:CR=1 FL=1|tara:strand:- start:1348 stop:1785 length:438 start_codon:yes stop_codon:yes gene_type:complete